MCVLLHVYIHISHPGGGGVLPLEAVLDAKYKKRGIRNCISHHVCTCVHVHAYVDVRPSSLCIHTYFTRGGGGVLPLEAVLDGKYKKRGKSA